MPRPVEGSFLCELRTDSVESMKFSLQSVKISTQIRKKMIDSTYLDNANLTSVTLTPNSRRPQVLLVKLLFCDCLQHYRMVSTQPYGYVRDTSGLRSLAHHFELYFNRMNKVRLNLACKGQLQESYMELQNQLQKEQQQVKTVSDCEVELRICFDSVPQVVESCSYSLDFL